MVGGLADREDTSDGRVGVWVLKFNISLRKGIDTTNWISQLCEFFHKKGSQQWRPEVYKQKTEKRPSSCDLGIVVSFSYSCSVSSKETPYIIPKDK